MGSLFDGIGGFPLAASKHGIKTLWASEIEPFPVAVTKLRLSDMIHVGDITKLNQELSGCEVEQYNLRLLSEWLQENNKSIFGRSY